MSGRRGLGGLLAASAETLDVYAERLLEAARAELLKFGVRRTSLDDIARAAQVGRATLFRRFPNRGALHWALAAREAQRSISRVDREIAHIDDPEELLVTGAIAVIREIAGNELLQRLLETDADAMLPLLVGPDAVIAGMGREYIACQLRRVDPSGSRLTLDADVVGELLARLVLSIALNPAGALPLDDEKALAEIVRAIASGLIREQT